MKPIQKTRQCIKEQLHHPIIVIEYSSLKTAIAQALKEEYIGNNPSHFLDLTKELVSGLK